MRRKRIFLGRDERLTLVKRDQICEVRQGLRFPGGRASYGGLPFLLR